MNSGGSKLGRYCCPARGTVTTFSVRVCISYSDSDVIYTHIHTRAIEGLRGFAKGLRPYELRSLVTGIGVRRLRPICDYAPIDYAALFKCCCERRLAGLLWSDRSALSVSVQWVKPYNYLKSHFKNFIKLCFVCRQHVACSVSHEWTESRAAICQIELSRPFSWEYKPEKKKWTPLTTLQLTRLT